MDTSQLVYSFPHLMDTGIFPTFWLLWIVPPWTFKYSVIMWTFVFISLRSVPISRIIDSYNKYMFNATKQLLNCFLKWLKGKMSILLFQWQYIRIPVALHPHQNLILDSLNHSSEGLVVFHLSFNFCFPSANDIDHPSCAHIPFISFLWWRVSSNILPVIFWWSVIF